jgi:hypothetical protein
MKQPRQGANIPLPSNVALAVYRQTINASKSEGADIFSNRENTGNSLLSRRLQWSIALAAFVQPTYNRLKGTGRGPGKWLYPLLARRGSHSWKGFKPVPVRDQLNSDLYLNFASGRLTLSLDRVA